MKFIFLLMLLVACGPPGERQRKWGEEKKEKEVALLVKSVSVKRGDVALHQEFTGVLESKSQANIVPETSGLVKKVYVREGDQISRGDRMAVLHNPAVNAAAERASIEYQRLKSDFRKSEKLHQQGAVSDREYQDSKSALRTAKSSHREAQKSKKSTTIRSPIRGVVSVVDIRAGEQAGAARAFQVLDPSKLQLVASVPEREMSEVKEGLEVQISAAYDEKKSSTGHIERVGPVIDPATGSVKLFIDVEPKQKALLPGQFVRAKVEVDRHENCLVIPKSALIYRDGQPAVFVVADKPPEEDTKDTKNKKDNNDEQARKSSENKEKEADIDSGPKKIAQLRDLVIGYTDINSVEVLEGLTEGELVITVGNNSLRTGSLIQLESAASEDDQKKSAEVPKQTDEPQKESEESADSESAVKKSEGESR